MFQLNKIIQESQAKNMTFPKQPNRLDFAVQFIYIDSGNYLKEILV